MPDSVAPLIAGRKPILVWGTAGQASVVVDVLGQYDEFSLAGLIDDVHLDRRGCDLMGTKVLGDSQLLENLYDDGVRHLFVAIGDNASRVACAERAKSFGFEFPTLVDRRGHVGGRVELGVGTVLLPLSAVNSDAVVGDQVIVNTGAIVEHDCRVGNGAHIGPGAVVAGRASIGEQAWIGAGAVVRDRVNVGSRSVIGAGAVVVKDVPAGVVAVGVPARPLRDSSRQEATS